MGRRKQLRPHRSVGILDSSESAESGLRNERHASENAQREESVYGEKPFFVEVDRSSWDSNEHFDISEVILMNLNLSSRFSGFGLSEGFYQDSKYSLRFRLCNVCEFIGRMRLGHWPVLLASDIYLEFTEKCMWEDKVSEAVIVSGRFDGPDEGVSGLVHLASLKFLTLRPVLGFTFSEEMSSLRLRVEILKRAFNACDSLLDTSKQLWRTSMMSVMAWLRPEVITSEARYRYNDYMELEMGLHMEIDDYSSSFSSSSSRKRARFDAAVFYEAIKPSKGDPMLVGDISDLLPELRPYQRRAAYWMVQREKGASECSSESERSQFLSPLCMPVNLIDTCSTMFYNPFSGNISLYPECSSSYVFGGILADEMGLGKTVELLACIFAHRKSASVGGSNLDDVMQITGDRKLNLKRLKRERVECICGAVSESSRYEGLWVQCDMCDAWQHADCVGYSTGGRTSKSREVSKGQDFKNQTNHSRKRMKRRNDMKIVVMDGDHICQLCSELIQVTDAPVATGATLIVCPAPILPQWHAEIIRHTNPGSLKTCVYEGVRNTLLANKPPVDISELLGADIVLTTYDVLKEDLSHDSDRHEGDRRFMRFQKRYPVIPTLLTRLFWWRICLDEAQMVESNTAAATEMALRLHAKYRWCITGTPIQRKLDDLYGLLKFLKASPFDVLRWWTEVIRDPYESGDAGAMRFTHKFFKQIMWRSSKVNVAEELQLPPQEECLTWLSLSPIEEHFYQRQHETCVHYAREVIESFKDDNLKQKMTGSMSSDAGSDFVITHVEAAKLLNSLLKLRQACCHPQVGSSGLRSLQQSPMTMDEILSVLVGKTKVEGEEALRKSVVALNGLAGIAIINQDFSQAATLYREALALAEEHSEDFRLDPLLSIHIHHNLAEILPLSPDNLRQLHSIGQSPESSRDKASSISDVDECDQCDDKGEKTSGEDSSDMTIAAENLANGSNHSKEYDAKVHIPSRSSSDSQLRATCDNLKQKFLSVFNSKLSLAQQEFRKSHAQVCNTFSERKNQLMIWWLEALHHIEQNKDSTSEFIRKIEEAVCGSLNVSRTSKIASCFRSITALKYYIQTGLDSLEDSRRNLLDRLVEIDQMMGNPREEDIERVRYCPNCQANGEGLICLHCELDELFQIYEARLFRLNKGHDGGFITSAEEAVDLQKKKSALNRFYWTLSRPDKNSTSSSVKYEDNGGKRDAGEKVMVSRSPSELEVVLGIIKSFSKTLLGKDGMAAATKQLLLLEGMRKEYAQARLLAIAQAQVLRAHDEIKMATSRLRLQENEDDKSIDALSPGELDAANAENSSDKFLALALLSRIKGQLRYLKGLVHSKQKNPQESPNNSSLNDVAVVSSSTIEKEEGRAVKADEEACPVCQEKLNNQKMVFQCGHVTCCKCLFAMTEQRFIHHGKFHAKWVMCPTCRQHTDFGNIAFADDTQNKSEISFLGHENSEASITVHGSYGTKIEAITRRILWISSTDPKAKLLVFSSWNDVLDVLEHAFAANSISFIRMKGGRKAQVAINQFKGQRSSSKGRGELHDQQPETKPVQVLLLLIQHGANGLNLLEAQHVILVEPLLNPAAEAQAIGRVHRIGQENRTLVHRFIVKNTVEESIYKLNRSRSAGSFISGNTKNQDQPVLTLKDVESLFAATPSTIPESGDEKPSGSLMHLPPSVAAAIAAERRLMEQTGKPS